MTEDQTTLRKNRATHDTDTSARATGDASARIPTLRQVLRREAYIHAHQFCEVTGIRPATLRQLRYRARRAGQPDPLGARTVSGCRVLVSLRSAAEWLQQTGRYSALLRLAEWIEQEERTARRDMWVPDVPFRSVG